MTALTIRLLDSIRESIRLLARKDGISVNQSIASAAAEKMASLQTLDYLHREAALGKREDFERFLKLVPAAPAQAGDTLSSKDPLHNSLRSVMSRTRAVSCVVFLANSRAIGCKKTPCPAILLNPSFRHRHLAAW